MGSAQDLASCGGHLSGGTSCLAGCVHLEEGGKGKMQTWTSQWQSEVLWVRTALTIKCVLTEWAHVAVLSGAEIDQFHFNGSSMNTLYGNINRATP